MSRRKRRGVVVRATGVELTEDAIAQAVGYARRSTLYTLVVPPQLQGRAEEILAPPAPLDPPGQFYGAEVEVDESLEPEQWAVRV